MKNEETERGVITLPSGRKFKANLRFEESFNFISGSIGFTYTRSVGSLPGKNKRYETRGAIPNNIVKKGKKAILNYALQKIDEYEKRLDEMSAVEENIRKNHIPIKTEYKSVKLEGRIVEATSRFIRVELDKPLKGSSIINYGYGAAVMGYSVFDEKHKISEEGFDSACRALCWAYMDSLHKPQKGLVKGLNEKLKKGLTNELK